MLNNLYQGVLAQDYVFFLDILVLLSLIIFIYRFLKGSVAFYILFGLFILTLAGEVFSFFKFKLLIGLYHQFSMYGLIFTTIIFQPEIRRLLLVIGRNKFVNKVKTLKRLFVKGNTEFKEKHQITNILDALLYMSERKIGAIIVIQQSGNLKQYRDTGVKINAELSGKLIEAIFAKDSPLHDGAVIIEDFLIKSAGCTLPVSENDKLNERIGLRHKSGVGITEVSDAIVFIVSEETGKISFAEDGNLNMGINEASIIGILKKTYSFDG